MSRFASQSRRAPASFTVAELLAGALISVPARAQLTYKLASGFDAWLAAKRTAIINAMNEAVALYNAHDYFPRTLTANYNAGVLTTQAGYGDWIDFGGSISTRAALFWDMSIVTGSTALARNGPGTLTLASWQTAGINGTILSDTGTLQTIQGKLPLGTIADRRFLRLRDTLP